MISAWALASFNLAAEAGNTIAAAASSFVLAVAFTDIDPTAKQLLSVARWMSTPQIVAAIASIAFGMTLGSTTVASIRKRCILYIHARASIWSY
ncbi:MAG: hypothetical protein WAO58_12750 [Fimbriimonadaceae bacterium]